MENAHIIKMQEYLGKMSDIYLHLDYSLEPIQDPNIKAKALSKWMKGSIPEFMYDKAMYRPGISEKEMQGHIAKIERDMANSYLSKFDHSTVLMLNMSFVMLITILEIYFEHIFAVIINANRNVLLTLSKEKNITLESMIKCSDLGEAIDKIKTKCIDDILRKGIKEVFSSLELIGVKKDKVFS